MRINIKPLSVNKCWQGRRYKTAAYKAFSDELRLKLKHQEIPEGPLEVKYTFGFSNMRSDYDNPVKPFQDVLCDFLDINDSQIHRAVIEKVKTSKGAEFIDYEISEYVNQLTE